MGGSQWAGMRAGCPSACCESPHALPSLPACLITLQLAHTHPIGNEIEYSVNGDGLKGEMRKEWLNQRRALRATQGNCPPIPACPPALQAPCCPTAQARWRSGTSLLVRGSCAVVALMQQLPWPASCEPSGWQELPAILHAWPKLERLAYSPCAGTLSIYPQGLAHFQVRAGPGLVGCPAAATVLAARPAAAGPATPQYSHTTSALLPAVQHRLRPRDAVRDFRPAVPVSFLSRACRTLSRTLCSWLDQQNRRLRSHPALLLHLCCSTGLITVPATVVGMPAGIAAATMNAYGGNFTTADMEALQAETAKIASSPGAAGNLNFAKLPEDMCKC